MKVYGDLEITGRASDLELLLQRIDANLKNGWTRDSEAEETLADPSSGHTFVYSCSAQEPRPEASLCLWQSSPGKLEVVNIVPAQSGELSHDEYNAIREEFRVLFVEPARKDLAVEVMTTPAEVTIEHWVSPKTAKALERFSALANKSTGSSHPLDKKRWYEFLVRCHKEQSKLDTECLRRWLQEHDGWSEDIAWRLSLEYESARSLLEYYDEQTQNA